MSENWILLIDPFRNLVNAYRLILEGQGYFFDTAKDLNEAIQKLSARSYSVILTEYFPPFEETYLMIRKVKQTHPETSVVMITNAIIDEASYEKLFDAGFGRHRVQALLSGEDYRSPQERSALARSDSEETGAGNPGSKVATRGSD